MTRIMRDSVTPSIIRRDGLDMVAGYVNGSYAWSSAEWNLFPHIPHVTIDVNGSRTTADVLDVEPGDASPAGAVRWVKAKKKLNGTYPPVLYVNRSNRGAVQSALRSAGFKVHTDYRLWVATLDGTETLSDMDGVIAIQTKGSNLNHANYDESIVFDDQWKNPGHNIMTLSAADLAAVREIVKEERDWNAGAVMWWLRRVLDPTLPLPTPNSPVASFIHETTAALRTDLANEENALVKSIVGALNAPHKAVQAADVTPVENGVQVVPTTVETQVI